MSDVEVESSVLEELDFKHVEPCDPCQFVGKDTEAVAMCHFVFECSCAPEVWEYFCQKCIDDTRAADLNIMVCSVCGEFLGAPSDCLVEVRYVGGG